MNFLSSYGIHASFLAQAALYPENQLARVTAQYQGKYKIVTEQGEQLAKISGKLRYDSEETSDYPVVGVCVMVPANTRDSDAMIHRVLPRHSLFVRKIVGMQGQL